MAVPARVEATARPGLKEPKSVAADEGRLSPRQPFQQGGGDMFAVLADRAGAIAFDDDLAGRAARDGNILTIGSAFVSLNGGGRGAIAVIFKAGDAPLTLIDASSPQRARANMQQDVGFGVAHSPAYSSENNGAAPSNTARGSISSSSAR